MKWNGMERYTRGLTGGRIDILHTAKAVGIPDVGILGFAVGDLFSRGEIALAPVEQTDSWLSQKRCAFLTSCRKSNIFEMPNSRYPYPVDQRRLNSGVAFV